MLKALSLLLVHLALASFSEPGVARVRRPPQTPASIAQLVESRNGRVSCWGVGDSSRQVPFQANVKPEQIVIREAKHGHDLTGTMTWLVKEKGKRLVIKFKPGTGDFGSGSSVDVQVDRSAFAGKPDSPNERFGWSINTDVL